MKTRVLLAAGICLILSSCISAPKDRGWIQGGALPKVKVIVEYTKPYDNRSAESLFADCLSALDDLDLRYTVNKELGRIYAIQAVFFEKLFDRSERGDTRKVHTSRYYFFFIVSELEETSFLSIRIAEPGQHGKKVIKGEVPLNKFLAALEKRLKTSS